MTTATERQRITAARRIAQARLDMGHTQVELAEQTGLSRRAISDWETGKSRPQPRCLRVLSEFLGQPIWWLRASDVEDPDGESRHDL